MLRLSLFFFASSLLLLADDPGSALGTSLSSMFTGPLVLGLTIAGIVVGGCFLMFGGGQAIRILGGVLIGGSVILGAPRIAAWLQTIVT